MSISTHILDTALGRPAAGVPVSLTRHEAGSWVKLAHETTDSDGRCKNLLGNTNLTPCVYRIRFETGAYFERIGVEGLYPYVEVAFHVHAGQRHYHIPLLLTANGYSTYRGT